MRRRPRLQFLRFDAAREASFQAEYAAGSLRYMRIPAGVLAALNIVGLLGTAHSDWIDVLGPLVLAIEALGFLAFTYWLPRRQWVQAALVVVALYGLANLAVQAVTTFDSLDSGEASRANWVTTFTLYLAAGLLGLYTLLRLRFWYSAFTGWAATPAWLLYASGAGMLELDPVVRSATMLLAATRSDFQRTTASSLAHDSPSGAEPRP